MDRPPKGLRSLLQQVRQSLEVATARHRQLAQVRAVGMPGVVVGVAMLVTRPVPGPSRKEASIIKPRLHPSPPFGGVRVDTTQDPNNSPGLDCLRKQVGLQTLVHYVSPQLRASIDNSMQPIQKRMARSVLLPASLSSGNPLESHTLPCRHPRRSSRQGGGSPQQQGQVSVIRHRRGTWG